MILENVPAVAPSLPREERGPETNLWVVLFLLGGGGGGGGGTGGLGDVEEPLRAQVVLSRGPGGPQCDIHQLSVSL